MTHAAAPVETPWKPGISLFFPVYNDEATVRTVTEKAIAVLEEIAAGYEIVIVDDGSPDRAGAIADELARTYPQVSVVHHPRNLGYGAAVQSGFRAARRYEWICFTDGDDQYDVRELKSLIRHLPKYDMLVTFRYARAYSTWRMFVSWVYNHLLRFLFRCRYRDISSGLRLVRRELIDDIDITSTSPFVGAEIVLKGMLKGYLIGEAGISTYPRAFGASTSTSWANIVATVRDMLRVYREVYRNKPRPEH